MPTIREIRENYPQYSDMSDMELANALYNKFYSDMSKEEFYSKIELNQKETPQPGSKGTGYVDKAVSSLKENAPNIASKGADLLPIAGAITGGTVAAPANLIAPGVSELAGTTLGYMGGSQARDRVKELLGKQPQSTLGEASQKSVSDIKPGLETGLLGPILSKGVSMLLSGGGKLGKAILGRMSGTGTKAVDEAVESGKSMALSGENPITSKTAYDKALRGKISGEEVTVNAKNALQRIRDQRGSEYVAKLNNIKTDPTQLNNIKSELDTELLNTISKDKFNIKAITSPTGNVSFDFSKSTLVKGQPVVKKALKDIITWQDNSVAGLDVLKKRLSTYIDQTKDGTPARALLTKLKNNLKDNLNKQIPQYQEMTKEYAELTNVVKDLESGLLLKKQGMSGRVTADKILRRLNSAMRDNFELRGELVDLLSRKGSEDVAGQVAGHVMRSPLPHGLAGTGPAMIGEAALAHYIDPKFYAVVAASSPRVQGEFLRLYGRGLGEMAGSLPLASKITAAELADIVNKEK